MGAQRYVYVSKTLKSSMGYIYVSARGRSSLHTARTEEDKVQNRKGRKVETLYAFITLYCIYSFTLYAPIKQTSRRAGEEDRAKDVDKRLLQTNTVMPSPQCFHVHHLCRLRTLLKRSREALNCAEAGDVLGVQ